MCIWGERKEKKLYGGGGGGGGDDDDDDDGSCYWRKLETLPPLPPPQEEEEEEEEQLTLAKVRGWVRSILFLQGAFSSVSRQSKKGSLIHTYRTVLCVCV